MSIFRNNNRPVWADYLLLTIGALIIAVSVKNIFDPAKMVIGGASGLAIIIKADVYKRQALYLCENNYLSLSYRYIIFYFSGNSK